MAAETIEDLLVLATNREHEAYLFYSEVAGRVENPGVKKIFEELAEDEKGHEALMMKFRSDPSLRVKFKSSPDFKLAESVETPELSVDMKPADAVALAMKKEQQAHEFYSYLASWCDDAELEAVYENLAKMELGHKHRLEKIYTDIAYVEVW